MLSEETLPLNNHAQILQITKSHILHHQRSSAEEVDFLGVVGADAPPLDGDNIGNRLLRNLGWTPGTGLGPTGEGLREPVVATARPRRLGLGGSQTSEEIIAEEHSHTTAWVRPTMPPPDADEGAGAAPTTTDLMTLLQQMAADNKKEREARLQREIASNAREAQLRQALDDQQKQMEDLRAALTRFQVQHPPPPLPIQGLRTTAPAAAALRPNLQTIPTPFIQPPVFPAPAAPPNSGATPTRTSGTNSSSHPAAPATGAAQLPPSAALSTEQLPPVGAQNVNTHVNTPPPATFSVPFSDTGSLLNPAYLQNAGQNAQVTPPNQEIGTGAITGQALDQAFGATARPTLVETITPLDAQSQLSTHSRRGKTRSQGRGRARAPSRRLPQPDDDYDDDDSDEETGEEGDGYERNRERRERPGNSKYLHLDKFSRTNKEQDFPVWVRQYQDSIRRNFNPHSKRRHHDYCIEWLPSLLDTEAYAIWEKAEHRNTNWELLKNELELMYEDPTMRTEWRNNLKAYTWDEHNVSLQTYAAKVKRYVDTFETEMADCPSALKGQYYLRFFNGLPEDYQGQVTLSLTSKQQDIEKAMEVCLRFQSFKKNKGKKEVAAGVTFQEDTVPARVATNEAELARVKNQLRKLEQRQSTPPSTPNHLSAATSNTNAGNSPYYANPQNRDQYPRDRDRIRRFLANRRGGRGARRSYHPRSNDPHQKQTTQHTAPATSNHQETSPSEQAALEEGLALESEFESDYDGDETLAMYKEYLLDKELAGLADFRDLKNEIAEN